MEVFRLQQQQLLVSYGNTSGNAHTCIQIQLVKCTSNGQFFAEPADYINDYYLNGNIVTFYFKTGLFLNPVISGIRVTFKIRGLY